MADALNLEDLMLLNQTLTTAITTLAAVQAKTAAKMDTLVGVVGLIPVPRKGV